MTAPHWLTPEDAWRYTADLRQISRIDSLCFDSGSARGGRLLRLVTGGGLEVEILPDRGMDIGAVTIDGVPISWASPAVPASAAHTDHRGDAWNRTFSGGLLTTAGLDTFGSASVDDGRAYGQHGRASSLSADYLTTSAPALPGDEPALRVSGQMRQGAVFAENLLWRRTISAPWGGRSFSVTDHVTNLGPRASPHLLLYHLNFGWPLISPDTRLHADPAPLLIEGRDPASAQAEESWDRFEAPLDASFPEHVLRHHLRPATTAHYRIDNPRLGLSATVSFPTAALPWLFQWRVQHEREYVLALEPATADAITGRAEAMSQRRAPILLPGQSATTSIEISLDKTD